MLHENSGNSLNAYVSMGPPSEINHGSSVNFIIVNDSIEENERDQPNQEELEPLENISREAFNSNLVRFIYYSRRNLYPNFLNDDTISNSNHEDNDNINNNENHISRTE